MIHQKIPGPKKLPIIGNAHQINPHTLHLQVRDWTKQYGDFYSFKILNRPIYVISNQEEILKALMQRPKKFRRLSVLETLMQEMGAAGIFAAEGDVWVREKRIISPAFSKKQISNFYPTLQKISNRLLKKLESIENKPSIDMKEILSAFTVDVTTEFAFGFDGNTLENDDVEVQKHLKNFFYMMAKRSHAPFAYWRYIKLSKDRNLDKSTSFVREFVQKYIDKAQDNINQGKELSTVLEAMIYAGNDEDHPFTQDELIGNTLTMLLAGEDTTSNSLAWALYFLTGHREQLQELQKRLSILPDNINDITNEMIDEIVELDYLINETLRLKPVAPYLYMENLEDVVIGNRELKKGSSLIINTSWANFKESIYQDAMTFKFNRWKDLNENIHKSSFFPFGFGPRICPGRYLSIIEMKMALIVILKNFDIKLLGSHEEIKELFNFTVTPSKLNLKLNRVNN